jgi:hypothetical protein
MHSDVLSVLRSVRAAGRASIEARCALRVNLTARHPASGADMLIIGCHLVALRGEVNAAVPPYLVLSGFIIVRDRSEFQELNRRAVVNDHRHCHTWRGTVRFKQDFLTFEGPGKVIHFKSNVR